MNDENKNDEIKEKNSLFLEVDEKCIALTIKNQECKGRIYENNYCKRHYKLYRLEKPDDCIICTEDLTIDQKPLSCGHWVHRKCIVIWGKDICPICKKKITLTATEHRQINKQKEKQQLEMIVNFLMTMLYTFEDSIQSPEIHSDPDEDSGMESEMSDSDLESL